MLEIYFHGNNGSKININTFVNLKCLTYYKRQTINSNEDELIVAKINLNNLNLVLICNHNTSSHKPCHKTTQVPEIMFKSIYLPQWNKYGSYRITSI